MQCVTAVEPQWLAELGPMFFSVKDSNTSRLEQRRKQKEEKSVMEQEMEELRKKQWELLAQKQEKEKATRSKQKQSIVMPGAKQQQRIPLVKKVGL
jgi:pre-mRNA-splicing factor ATP-dependent RNA helicase DHX38/PRP16